MSTISIIVPVYNTESFLRECIDSLLAQSFTDYEIILVDDGSTDSSGKICDAYKERNEKIHVIHKPNGGLSDARNAGLRFAANSSGEWVTFVDGDDIVHPEYLERLYNAAIKSSVKMALCDITRGEKPVWSRSEGKNDTILIDEETLLGLFSGRQYWCVIPGLYAKEIPLKYPFTKGRIHEDNAVQFKWLIESGAFTYHDAPLYFYRDTPNSIMNKKFSLKRLDFLWAMEEQAAFYDSVGYKKMLEKVICLYADNAVWFSKRIAKELDDEIGASEVLKSADRFIEKHNARYLIESKDRNYIDKRLHKIRYHLRKIRNKSTEL